MQGGCNGHLIDGLTANLTANLTGPASAPNVFRVERRGSVLAFPAWLLEA
jgi:hypothetical protein